MKTLLLIFALLPLTLIAQEEPIKNPTRGPVEYPGGNTLRTGTWSLGGMTFKELKRAQPLPLILPNQQMAKLPLELMLHYKIDILCLNDIKQPKFPWGIEPPAGTIVAEGVDHTHNGESYYIRPAQIKTVQGPLFLTYEHTSIVVNKSKVTCMEPFNSTTSFGASKKSTIHWSRCWYKPSRLVFYFGCTHIDEKPNELRESLRGFDQMLKKLPTDRLGNPNPIIIGGDFNSFPNKKSGTTNPHVKSTLGWNELEIPLPREVFKTDFNDEDITFTKLFPNRGQPPAPAQPEKKVFDDILMNTKAGEFFIQKSVVPVQIFPLKPDNMNNDQLPNTTWLRFNKVSDHLPVIADFFIP